MDNALHPDVLRAQLRHIEHADPDGGEVEPTEADYAAHKRWAIEAFGLDTWNVYRAGGWAE